MIKDEVDAVKMYKDIYNEYHDLRSNGSLMNEYIEVPAMIKMLGNLSGKRVLDWGCGSGIYLKKLKGKCKVIKGFDISPEMVKIAKRINPDVEIKIGSGTKIPFNEKFDVVFASLAIHYLKDLNKTFKEVRRVLKDGGIFIFSTGNIITKAGKTLYVRGRKYKVLGKVDYFNLYRSDNVYTTKSGKKVKVFNYIIKPKEVIQASLNNNFQLIDYEDIKPISSYKKVDLKQYNFYIRVPLFAIWKLRKIN